MDAAVLLEPGPRVFLVIPSLNGGGAERAIVNLAHQLKKRNYLPTLVSLSTVQPGYSIDPDIPVMYILERKEDTFFLRIYNAGFTFFSLIRCFRRGRPDFVISFITSANLWSAMICLLFKVPYVVSERTSPRRTILAFNPLLKRLAYQCYRRADALIVGSYGIEARLKEDPTFARLANVKIIRNSVTRFGEVVHAAAHSRPFILGVGRLSYVKGFDILVKAFAIAETSEFDLIIVGEGEEREALEQLVSELHIESRVLFPGKRANLQDYYSAATIFVLPSRNEGYPNSLIEAMSFGCACVATDCEYGPCEIVNEEQNGLLVPVENPRKMAEAMNRLIADRDLHERVSHNALKITESNDDSIIYREWEKLIN